MPFLAAIQRSRNAFQSFSEATAADSCSSAEEKFAHGAVEGRGREVRQFGDGVVTIRATPPRIVILSEAKDLCILVAQAKYIDLSLRSG